jgi:hypothetical protein
MEHNTERTKTEVIQ